MNLSKEDMRKNNYVCGFKGDNQIVYGKDHSSDMKLIKGNRSWIQPMTLGQAKKYAEKANEFNAPSPKMVVFELKEVK